MGSMHIANVKEREKGIMASVVVARAALDACCRVAIDGNSFIQVRDDGSAWCANKKGFVAVGPMKEEWRKSFPLKAEGGMGNKALSAQAAKAVLKNCPRDGQFGGLLEAVRIEDQGGGTLLAESTNGMHTSAVKVKEVDRVLSRAPSVMRSSGKGVRAVVNRKRLLLVLEALDKAFIDTSGNAEVEVEFEHGTGDLIFRCQDPRTGLRAVGFTTTYRDVERLDPDAWERKMTGESVVKPRPRKEK